MADTTCTLEGFGEFHYDAAVYGELMKLSKAELVERELDGTTFQRTSIRGLKKADLAVLVAHRETACREWDESVNEVVDGGEVMTRWLALPEDKRSSSIESQRTKLEATASPEREYQSVQEALAVLNDQDGPSSDDHLCAEDLSEFYADQGADADPHPYGCDCPACEESGAYPPVDYDPMANATADEWDAHDDEIHDADADAELISFMRTVVDAPTLPEPAITETDVRAPSGDALVTLVQFGSKLIWGKLISVVNRRTKYCAPLLATVEIAGVRRLVSADDVLVSDTFVAGTLADPVFAIA